MTTTYSDIEPLRDAGKSPAAIADELLARRWTVRAIPVADLTDWLREERVDGVPIARYAPDGSWDGVLPDLIGGAHPADLQDAWKELLSHLRNPKSQDVHTNEGERGVLLDETATACGITASQRTSLYALGGGERFADATESNVQSIIDRHDALQAYRDAHSTHVVPVLDSDAPTKAEIATALRDAADQVEAV